MQRMQERANQEYKDTIDPARRRELESSAEAVKPIMLACEENAHQLQTTFDKVIPSEQATRLERYRKAVQAVMPDKKRKVEDLMKGIIEQLQLLHTDQFFKDVTKKRSDELAAAIKGLSAVPSALPEEEGRIHHSRSGPMNNQTGLGKQVNNAEPC